MDKQEYSLNDVRGVLVFELDEKSNRKKTEETI